MLKLIRNSPRLHTFVTYECKSITNETMEALRGHSSNLEQLSMSVNDNVDLREVEGFKNLRALMISTILFIGRCLLGSGC